MKSSKNLDGWNALLGVSIFVFVSSLAFRFLMPPPKPSLNSQQRLKKESTVFADRDTARSKTTEGQATIARYVWPGDAKLAEAEAMAMITKLAAARDVSLGGFRPQKSTEDSGLRRLPFTLTIEAPFPSVMKFLGDLETPGSRLSVKMMQISATDGSSDHVAATLTVIAFQELKKPNIKGGKVATSTTNPGQPASDGTKGTVAPPDKLDGNSAKLPSKADQNLNKPTPASSQQG